MNKNYTYYKDMNILNTDLNLLKVFRALYEHKNQSIAAKQINININLVL